MCTLRRAHIPCAYYYVHTSMCTSTFHTWNAGPQNVSTLLHVEYGSVTKQPSHSMLLRENILQLFFKHKAMAALQVAFVLLRPLYELYPACTWSAFHSFSPRRATLRGTLRPECLWNLHTGHWDGSMVSFLGDVSSSESLRQPSCYAIPKHTMWAGTWVCVTHWEPKCVLHIILHPRKCIFHLSKSVRQKWYLILANVFLLARINVLFCFAINWLTIVSSLRNCLLINDFSCFSFKTLLKIQKIVLIKV